MNQLFKKKRRFKHQQFRFDDLSSRQIDARTRLILLTRGRLPATPKRTAKGLEFMTANCDCQQCGKSIEFEAAELERSGETSYRVLGQFIDCPHCGKSTQLYMPRHAIASPKNSGVPKSDAKKVEAIYLLGAIVLPLFAYAASAAGLLGDSEDVITVIIGVACLPLYFVPAIVGRNKKNAQAIFMLNLLAGWTFIGWVMAMVWACTKD